MFHPVCLEGFPPACKVICKVTSQVECPAACLVVWEVGCRGDQVDPAHNSFHQTKVQGLAICKGYPINNILLTQVIPRFNRPDPKAYLRRLEWDIQVQRRHSRC